MSVTVAFTLTGLNCAGSIFCQNLASDQSYRAKKKIFRPRREHVPTSETKFIWVCYSGLTDCEQSKLTEATCHPAVFLCSVPKFTAIITVFA